MFKKAKHFYAWFLRTFSYAAIINPFTMVCHVHESYYPPNNRLIRHENTHFEQIKRDGTVKFCFKYLWYLLRYGYENNPYELEAKKAENR